MKGIILLSAIVAISLAPVNGELYECYVACKSDRYSDDNKKASENCTSVIGSEAFNYKGTCA